jgi:predicted glycogen debranching enzyme
MQPPDGAEWLQPDQAGGFASGPVTGPRTRRYHALLLTATTPPTGRVVLVNGMEAAIATDDAQAALTTQRYRSGVLAPSDMAVLESFVPFPWPHWRFRLPDGASVEQEILVDAATGDTILRWQSDRAAVLTIRPLLSGRDYHAMHHENPAFRFAATTYRGNVTWHPYESLPAISALTNGTYRHDPVWYRGFLYAQEQARGLDDTEDLACPGCFTFGLGSAPAVVILRAGSSIAGKPADQATRVFAAEAMNRHVPEEILSAGAYVADRAAGATILAGYPWFTDWGRDSFIAVRGLLLATGQIEKATDVLRVWSGMVSEGMLPNRFADDGPPEYNTCDASLWFIVAVHDLLMHAGIPAGVAAALRRASDAILAGHMEGTRYGIGMSPDGLLRTGETGTQLTWMDARVDGVAVTPRVGKPVEIQALWYNALRIAGAWNPRWLAAAQRVADIFAATFHDPHSGGLIDVADADHVVGRADLSVRPNQIFAVGGLPFALLNGDAARGVVDLVQRVLLTPMGLRTLDPGDPRYCPRYAGGPDQRDHAYHQGTVWPWLIGPFVEAWLRVHGDTPANRAQARTDFLDGLETHLGQAGLGHISEIADGDAPHMPGGCPFQAWSLGELIRARRMTRSDHA